MTRPPSPVSRERAPFVAREEAVSLVHPNGCPSSAYQPLHDGRDDTLKERSSHLDIHLESHRIFLKGTGVDVEPAFLTGQVVLTLTEPTSLKEITLQFRGKTRLPVPTNEYIINSATSVAHMVCNHDWSFLEGDKRHSHTLKAGRHIFSFKLRVGGSLPSSISTHDGGAAVTYRLRAQATRSGLSYNLSANVPIHIIRSFSPEALEYQHTLEIENTWPEKLMYSIMVPHKAWAAGDTLTAIVKFSPLNKGISVVSVASSLHESTSTYARSGSQDRIRLLLSVKHEIVNGRAVLSESESPTSNLFVGGAGPSGIDCHAEEEDSSSASLAEGDHTIPENNDVETSLMIPIPSTAVPTHGIEPIIIAHRIRWSILIANPDGHASQLRCSLPLHILDSRLLEESRQYTAATRRLLIGGSQVPPPEEEVTELPSYTSHLRDRIAGVWPAGTNSIDISAASSPATPLTPEGGLTMSLFPELRSGYSSPSESSPFSYLPLVPDSGDNMPLEWINSELLLRQRPSRRLAFHTPDEHANSDHSSRPASQPPSRLPSRPASRSAAIPDPHNASTSTSTSNRSDSHRESHRNLHGILKATMKPFTSITQSNWLGSRAGSNMNLADLPGGVHHGQNRQSPSFLQSQLLSQRSQPPSPSQSRRESCSHTPELPIHPGLPRRNSQPADPGRDLPPRALTEVPNYDAASRGFLGGLPPLTSLQGLPSYEEAAMSGSSDLMVGGCEDPPRRSFGEGQRTRSEGDLVTRMAGLGGLRRRPSGRWSHCPPPVNG